MKNTPLLRRLLAIFAMVSLTLLGSAVASNAADAAPYGGSMSVTVTFGTNSSGQETVTVTITNGAAVRTYKIELQSTSAVLGFITTNASGNGSGTFVLPAGVTGPQNILVIDTVTGQVTSVAVDVPASGGATPVSSTGSSGGSSSGGLPNTGAAILGVGVLAVAFLLGGGLLLAVGRRRGNAKPAA